MVSRVDVRTQPGLYLIFAIIIGIATAINLIFSGLFQSRLILLIAPIVLGLTGMNHVFYYNTLVYQIYTAVALLLCLLFYPQSHTRSGLIGMSVLFCILPWCGPYSVLAVPAGFLLLLFFKGRMKSFLLVIAIISTLLYYATLDGGTTKLGYIFNNWIMSHYYKVLFENIFFLGLLGELTMVKAVIFLFCLLVLFYLKRKDPIYIKLSIVLLTLTVGALAPFFFSNKFPLYIHYPSCHLFISLFFWLVFLLYSLDQLVLRTGLKPVPVLLGLFLLVIVAIDNYPPERKRVEVIEEIPAFVDAIHHYEQLNLKEQKVYIQLQSRELKHELFRPNVFIGCRQRDAMQVGADYFKNPYGKQFIVDPADSS